jgi:hypothetical protein
MQAVEKMTAMLMGKFCPCFSLTTAYLHKSCYHLFDTNQPQCTILYYNGAWLRNISTPTPRSSPKLCLICRSTLYSSNAVLSRFSPHEWYHFTKVLSIGRTWCQTIKPTVQAKVGSIFKTRITLAKRSRFGSSWKIILGRRILIKKSDWYS